MALIVLAHGAWSAAWAWKKIRPLMASSGHQFIAPTYTGLGERAHLASPTNDLETHIQDLLGVLICEDLRDVVLLSHSYGGMVATGVADRARQRVRKLVYLDAFAPTSGQAMTDFLGLTQRQKMFDSVKSGDGWRVPPNPIPPDTSAEDVKWIKRFRMPQSVKCFKDPVHLNAELSLPRAYIRCTRNASQSPFHQFATRALAEGWPFHELDASHSPNVTTPYALMALLERVISE